MKRRARAPLPLVTSALAFAVSGTFAVELASGDRTALCYELGLVPAHPTAVSLLASPFLHDPGNAWHLIGNVVTLALFGTLVERSLGHARFVVLYALGSVGAAAFHVLANPGSLVPEVGASGPLFALMACASMLYPRLVGFVGAYAAFNVYETLTGTGGDVATAAHLGGFVVGFALMLFMFRRPLAEVRGWRRGARAAAA